MRPPVADAPAPPAAPTEAVTGAPLAITPLAVAVPRDLWLRLILFCAFLGTILTVVYARLLARQDGPAGLNSPSLSSYHLVLVPLLALLALAGALWLERHPAWGMVCLVTGCGLGLPGGAIWLLPASLLACAWAAVRQAAARTVLGFLLLLPGIASGYYGALGGLSYISGIPVRGLPPGLLAPNSLGQALAPLELIPVALLGAWLLLTRVASLPR